MTRIDRHLSKLSDAKRNGRKYSVDLADKAGTIPVDAPVEPILRYHSFPLGALPLPCRQFAIEAASAIGCDPVLIILPLLSALAGVIGNSCVIQLKRGWIEPAVIWSVIIAKSGQAKSPALDTVLRSLHATELDAWGHHAQAMEHFEKEMVIYDEDVKAWKFTGRKRGEPMPEKPHPPILNRTLIDDATVEAVRALLSENPRGLLLAHDELARWFKSFDAYRSGRGGDCQAWLSMHGARQYAGDRKTGATKTIIVPYAAVSICGGVQPEIFQQVLGSEHFYDGLAARLLLAAPPARVKHWTEDELTEETEALLANLFAKLYALELDDDGNGKLQRRVLPLTADGKDVLVKFYNQHAVEQAEFDSNLAAAWSKLEGYVARLALVVHLVRQVSGDRTLESNDEVDAASIQAAIEMVSWFAREAKRVYAMLSETDDDRIRRRLIEWIERKGQSVTPREIQQNCRWLRQAGAAETALEALVKAKIGDWQEAPNRPQGGRPARVFVLSKAANVNETETNLEEKEGSVDVDKVGAMEPQAPESDWDEI